MTTTTRRRFLKTSTAAALALGLPRVARASSANAEIRIAVIGLGGIDVVGGVGGRGRQLIRGLRDVPGARVTMLCDVDQEILDREVQEFKGRGQQVAACTDMRRVMDDKAIDAVAVATPNHWHALATIWACQAGKDVYVEKPFSYDIWEGRQMVAAAEKFGRIVQVGTQRRSSPALREAFAYLHSGQLGAIRCVHALVYRARNGIGKVDGPTPVPATVDYDLWCGPAPKGPLMRKQLHYDWHWVWPTGNGEIGNNGAHMIDVGRWALRETEPPRRVLSIGGRLAFDDDGQTANTQIALFDYPRAPIVCEIRNVRATKDKDAMGQYRGANRGVIIECEGGYLSGDAPAVTAFDDRGQKIKEFLAGKSREQTDHLANFVAAVASRDSGALNADARVGHVSAACCHMANASHRLGKTMPPDEILESVRSNAELADAFQRCREYLKKNGVDLSATQATLGPWVTPQEAEKSLRREDRAPFVVPEIA